MFVITYQDQIILGPVAWNPRYIASMIQQDLDLDQPPLIVQSDQDKVPYSPYPDVLIRHAVEVRDELNTKIQMWDGPFWEYTETTGTAHYTAKDKPLDLVKGELKNLVTANRYQKEIKGTTINIQGSDVSVDTNRGSRDIFVQKYLLMGDTDTVQWKFPECWLTLSKTELGQIVAAGVAYVQSQFDWEIAKHNEIDTCTTLTQLDAVNIAE